MGDNCPDPGGGGCRPSSVCTCALSPAHSLTSSRFPGAELAYVASHPESPPIAWLLPAAPLPALGPTHAAWVSGDSFLTEFAQGPRACKRDGLGPEGRLSSGAIPAVSVGKGLSAVSGPHHRSWRPGVCPAPAQGGWGVVSGCWQSPRRLNRLHLRHDPARPGPASHACRPAGSPHLPLHSFSGNEDVGDSRQV